MLKDVWCWGTRVVLCTLVPREANEGNFSPVKMESDDVTDMTILEFRDGIQGWDFEKTILRIFDERSFGNNVGVFWSQQISWPGARLKIVFPMEPLQTRGHAS